MASFIEESPRTVFGVRTIATRFLLQPTPPRGAIQRGPKGIRCDLTVMGSDHAMKRSFTIGTIAGVILTLPSAARAADQPRRPNILYVMADDHAARAISAYGSRINRTPHLDRIAKDGMRFTRCLVTNSICTP